MTLLPELVTPLPQHVAEFKALYRKHFGFLLSDEEAQQQLQHLLVIMEAKSRLT
jgi:hypothetical protein